MKKRISIFVLALLLLPCIFMLSACGGNDNKSNNSSQSQKYSITFIVDEKIYAKIETSGNEYIQLPTSPTKNGYTFDGWFLDKTTYQNELKANTYANTKLNSNINVFAKFTYIENQILAESISLDKTQLNMAIGQTYSLSATILPSNATNKNITWSSSNQNIATISNGKITSISVGQTTIKAQTNNGKFATCEVKVFNAYSNNFIYSVSKGKATITSFNNSQNLTVVVIPSYINSFPVETIGASAFINQTMLRNVIICNGIKTIEASAFYGCNSMESISLPNTLETIECNAFKNCEILEEITLPNSLQKIGANAFNNCNSLTSITIPDSVTSIESSAFSWCSELISIKVEEENEKYHSVGNCIIETNSKTLIVGCKTSIIPNDGSVTNIRSYAFSNCSSLTSITIPANVTSIGESAFYGCNSLISITIPNSVTSIGSSAFRDCSSLEEITIPFVGGSPTKNTYFGYIFGASSYSHNSTYVPSSLKKVVITSGTGISEYAFYKCNSLTSITIPNGVTNIGSYASRGCSSLTSIIIPNSVTSIGSSAFRDCSSLEEITIPFVGGSPTENTYLGYIFGASSYSYNSTYVPSSLKKVNITGGTEISEDAFYKCSSLTSITIPESVTSIGDYAFRDCSSLTSITIPNSVTSVGSLAFGDCESLTSIIIPDGVTSVGSSAFSGCTSLISVTISNSVTNICYRAFEECSSLTSLKVEKGNEKYHSVGNCIIETKSKTLIVGCKTSIIPNDGSVKSIESSAFNGCNSLTSITIPDSVTSIGFDAFNGCSGLTSIIIPSSVTSIGNYAFYGCSSLEEITIPFVGGSPTKNTYLGYIFGASSYSDNSAYVPSSLKKVNITGGTSIGASAFYGCSSLEEITIPFVGGSPTKNTYLGYIFGASSYSYNSAYVPSSLKKVNITGGTSIGSSAFNGCNSLTSITIPDSVTSIGFDAFNGCSSLTSMIIPDSVTSIGYDAFSGCDKLKNVVDDLVYIKTSTNNCYYLQDTTSTLLTSAIISENCKIIGSEAFYNCSGLTSIVIPDSVTSIGSYAFYNCSGLTSIVIPDSVTNIGSEAFYNCSGLTSIVIPDSVTSIGSYAFYNCSGLTSIVIPDSVTNIGSKAFYNCSGLTSIVIPDSVTSIGSYAFYNCSGLTSIVIPDSVTNIGSKAFYNCSGLKEVHISSLESWFNIDFGDYFSNYDTPYLYSNPLYYAHHLYLNETELTEIAIPNTITEIKKFALFGASYITSISIPHNVTSIGQYAFYNCSSLTSIIIPDSVTSIRSSAFSGCSGLTSIIIPSSVTSIGNYAFYGCSSLEEITIPFVGGSPTENTYLGYIFGASSYSYNSTYVPSSLKKVNITGGTSIGDYAFRDCSSLTSITIPDSVTSVSSSAFSGCSSLTSITIPNSVTSIGYDAFSGCKSLTSIIIPNSVTSIGSSAFRDCSSLEEITIPFVGGSPTENNYLGYIFGASSYSSNSSAVPFSLKKVNITTGTSIGGKTFYECSELISITMPNTVTSIGSSAFYYCSSLTSITIPDSVTSIDSKAFCGCSSLTSIKIPNNVTSIEESVFNQCTSLTTIEIPYGVTSIEEGAFYGCSGLTSIMIPNSVTNIECSAFSECSSLPSIIIPDSVDYVATMTFDSCNGLIIYCEATSQPINWSYYWNNDNCSVYWYRETKPTESGNYWHYVDGVVTKWE